MITKAQMNILEKYFNVYDNEECLELEDWTSGGVDMFITINKTDKEDLITQMKNYVDNFNIDEEIDLYRGNKEYRDNFTISESLRDFEDWLKYIKTIIDELEKVKEIKMTILDNVILNDCGLEYNKQKVLRIKVDDRVIYFDLIDNRINDYEVIVKEDTIITDLYI